MASCRLLSLLKRKRKIDFIFESFYRIKFQSEQCQKVFRVKHCFCYFYETCWHWNKSTLMSLSRLYISSDISQHPDQLNHIVFTDCITSVCWCRLMQLEQEEFYLLCWSSHSWWQTVCHSYEISPSDNIGQAGSFNSWLPSRCDRPHKILWALIIKTPLTRTELWIISSINVKNAVTSRKRLL